MGVQNLLIAGGALGLALFACRREHSREGVKQALTHTLPLYYPFATGYCKGGGTSLGVPIVDTSAYIPSNNGVLPAAFLLDMPTPGDQGSQGSCSAWATVYAAGTYNMHLKTGKPYADSGNLSPKFTYNQIAKGNCNCTLLLDNLYLLKTQGACSLAAMPYNTDECVLQPDSVQKSRAEPYKIADWQKVDLHNLTLIKRAITENRPVLFAISIDNGFKALAAPYIWNARTGVIGEGHAMTITGYDDAKNAFRIINSWSTGWGDKGFAWIDYSFFLENVIEGGYIVI